MRCANASTTVVLLFEQKFLSLGQMKQGNETQQKGTRTYHYLWFDDARIPFRMPIRTKKRGSLHHADFPFDLARCDLAFVKHAIINPFLLREGHTDYVFDILVLSLDLGKDVVAGVLLHRLLRVSNYTHWFSTFMNDDIARYGQQLTLTHINIRQFDFTAFMDSYLPSMMNVAIKQTYGIVIWISGTMTLLFMALDIPAVRTNIRRVPMWPVYGIDYLARLTGKRKA